MELGARAPRRQRGRPARRRTWRSARGSTRSGSAAPTSCSAAAPRRRVTRVGIAGFTAMRALSRRNDDPKAASRPFDSEPRRLRDGRGRRDARARGARARKGRGAKIYAELLGYGVSSDASHVTEPDPSGTNPARAMRMAFADAGISPRSATSTRTGRRRRSATRPRHGPQARARRGERARRRSPRRRARRATASALRGRSRRSSRSSRVQRGMLPPTINYEVPDPECDLDYIPNEARAPESRSRVSNSFGFGGHNACVVLPPLGRSALRAQTRSSSAQDRVAPDAVELCDPLTAADDAESEPFVEREARGVLREHARLDRPDSAGVGARDTASMQRSPDSTSARALRDVDRALGDPCVARSAGGRGERRPADDRSSSTATRRCSARSPRSNSPQVGVAVSNVARPCRDALGVDRLDRGPVRRLIARISTTTAD